MPARIIEELTSRKQEKIATFLTFESIVAVLLTFMPIFMISSSWPILVRIPSCAAAALVGYVMTVEVRGLPLYEHLIWTTRGLVRLRLHGNRVTPADLPGAVPRPDQDQVIAASGPITLVQRGAPTQLRSGMPPQTTNAKVAEPEDDDTPMAIPPAYPDDALVEAP
ncbi:MAG: hypothetical protein WCJ55_00115 [Chloroflexales bacterium]